MSVNAFMLWNSVLAFISSPWRLWWGKFVGKINNERDSGEGLKMYKSRVENCIKSTLIRQNLRSFFFFSQSMKAVSLVSTVILVCQAATVLAVTTDFTAMVDPFIGTGSGGYDVQEMCKCAAMIFKPWELLGTYFLEQTSLSVSLNLAPIRTLLITKQDTTPLDTSRGSHNCTVMEWVFLVYYVNMHLFLVISPFDPSLYLDGWCEYTLLMWWPRISPLIKVSKMGHHCFVMGKFENRVQGTFQCHNHPSFSFILTLWFKQLWKLFAPSSDKVRLELQWLLYPTRKRVRQ